MPTSLKDKQQKTDAVDSRKLAKGLKSIDFEAIHIPDVKLEADRALMRQRSGFSKDIAKTKNRVKSLLFQFGIEIADYLTVHQSRYWSAPFIKWLKAELKVSDDSIRIVIDEYLELGMAMRKQLLKLNRLIRALSQTEAYKENYGFVKSIPGFGCVTAMSFLLQIGDIGRFKTLDELNYYIGLVPSMYGSGDKMKTGKLVKRGRKDLKLMLIEASWIAVRYDPALMASFNELIKKMPKNKAIIRIARKLLNRLKYVLTHKQNYQIGIVK